MTHEIGLVTQTHLDWSLSQVVPTFSILVVGNGTAAALFGKWIDRVGPRIALTVGGMMVGLYYILMRLFIIDEYYFSMVGE